MSHQLRVHVSVRPDIPASSCIARKAQFHPLTELMASVKLGFGLALPVPKICLLTSYILAIKIQLTLFIVARLGYP